MIRQSGIFDKKRVTWTVLFHNVTFEGVPYRSQAYLRRVRKTQSFKSSRVIEKKNSASKVCKSALF